MEIWVEYLKRHGLPIVRPYPQHIEEFGITAVVRENPPYQQRDTG